MPDQLGREDHPQEYVERLVTGFREVKRVLRDDGTLWLVIGDSYSGGGNGGGGAFSGMRDWDNKNVPARSNGLRNPKGLKAKDLIGIPWMVAFALRQDGWYLRADIIWNKPNSMPESVQGSQYSRHRVNIEEYERLSGLRYIDERAGDAWAGDMPDMSEREIFSSKAPLSAKPEGNHNSKGKRNARGRAGKASSVQPITIREEEQSQIRSDRERQDHESEGQSEIPKQSAREGCRRETAPTDQIERYKAGTTAKSEQQIQANDKRQGSVLAAASKTQRGNSRDGQSANCGRVGANGSGSQGALLLLQAKEETDGGSCNSVEQRGTAHEVERGSGVRPVQFEQKQPPDSALLVGCPGCSQCIKHHGYIFHLSAGRPTRAHEYIFLLSKQARYYYDHEAIKDPPSPALIKQIEEGYNGKALKDYLGATVQDASATKSRIITGYRKRIDKQRGHSRRHSGFNEKWDALSPTEQAACGRNKRDVWTVAVANFKGAHFATYPADLIKPCVLAGSKAGDTILDPFFGSGTTGEVALSLGRKCIGIELNPEYVKMARQRCNVTMGLPL